MISTPVQAGLNQVRQIEDKSAVFTPIYSIII